MTDTNGSQAEIFRMIGRVEKTVDAIDTKLDGHSEAIARHDVRISNLEHEQQRQQQRGWERFALWIMVVVSLISALIAAIFPLIHR